MPELPKDDSQIDELKKKLFSNSGEELPMQRRVRLHKHNVVVSDSWDEDATKSNPVTKADQLAALNRRPKDRGPLLKKLLIGAAVVFVAAIGFAWYAFSTGINDISSANIDLRLVGPVTSPSGEELALDIDITNHNSANLELVDLVMRYPAGTRSASDRVSPMLTDRVPIGTIKPGQTMRETVKAVLFGEENVRKDIQVALEYRLKGSDSIFVKEKIYPVYIGSAPITVNVETVKEVIPEQENQFNVTIKSNSTSIIKDVVLKVDYPFGFEFMSSSPSASTENNTWILGDVKPQEERKIIIRGRLLGGVNEERIFNFNTGTADPRDAASIGTVFVTNAVPIALKRPFLGLDLALDSQSASTFVARAGQPIKGEITFQNNLNVQLQDVVIETRLSGGMLDKVSVVGDNAFYNSSNNTIVWDRTTLEDLRVISPGADGRLQFTFATLPPNTGNNSLYRRQSLDLDITVRAKRLNEDNVPEEIVSTITRTAKISSDINVDSRLVRSIGPFQNTGPYPPVPERASTYTVMVSVGNSYNTVNNAVYTATLPNYVTWVGVTYPNSNGATYNADTRQISWNLGNLAAGTGYASSPKDFAYQVSVLPSVSQVGTTPVIVNQQKITGTDSFTGKVIQSVHDGLDTKIERDPIFKFGDDKVGGK